MNERLQRYVQIAPQHVEGARRDALWRAYVRAVADAARVLADIARLKRELS